MKRKFKQHKNRKRQDTKERRKTYKRKKKTYKRKKKTYKRKKKTYKRKKKTYKRRIQEGGMDAAPQQQLESVPPGKDMEATIEWLMKTRPHSSEVEKVNNQLRQFKDRFNVPPYTDPEFCSPAVIQSQMSEIEGNLDNLKIECPDWLVDFENIYTFVIWQLYLIKSLIIIDHSNENGDYELDLTKLLIYVPSNWISEMSSDLIESLRIKGMILNPSESSSHSAGLTASYNGRIYLAKRDGDDEISRGGDGFSPYTTGIQELFGCLKGVACRISAPSPTAIYVPANSTERVGYFCFSFKEIESLENKELNDKKNRAVKELLKRTKPFGRHLDLCAAGVGCSGKWTMKKNEFINELLNRGELHNVLYDAESDTAYYADMGAFTWNSKHWLVEDSLGATPAAVSPDPSVGGAAGAD